MHCNKKPPNLPLNDETDYGLCFGCGSRNKFGLQLIFERNNNRVTTTFEIRPEHQGFPGLVHGGIVSTVLDEVMSRVSLLENRWAVTAGMNIKFRLPISVGQRVTAIGEKSKVLRGFLETNGVLKLPDGRIAAESVGKFAFLKQETLKEMTSDYPKLSTEWMI